MHPYDGRKFESAEGTQCHAMMNSAAIASSSGIRVAHSVRFYFRGVYFGYVPVDTADALDALSDSELRQLLQQAVPSRRMKLPLPE